MGVSQSVEQLAASRMTDKYLFNSAADDIRDIICNGGVVSYEKALAIYESYAMSVQTVRRFYPRVDNGQTILQKVMGVVREEGGTPENTLFAQSCCPDEINHEHNDITTDFIKELGEVFHLGGLGGIPFTGKTGFGAFAAHVPENGHLFIMISSHIGISNTHQLGFFSRLGQTKDGTACGAACGALNFCRDCNNTIPDQAVLGSNPHDYQMNYIISEVNKRKDTILQHVDPNMQQATLAIEMYKMAEEYLFQIISTEFHKKGTKPGKIFILGGIQVNMPGAMPDLFEPMLLQVHQHNKSTKNYLHRLNVVHEKEDVLLAARRGGGDVSSTGNAGSASISGLPPPVGIRTHIYTPPEVRSSNNTPASSPTNKRGVVRSKKNSSGPPPTFLMKSLSVGRAQAHPDPAKDEDKPLKKKKKKSSKKKAAVVTPASVPADIARTAPSAAAPALKKSIKAKPSTQKSGSSKA